MVSQATEIRDLLFTEWSLTGDLSKTSSENMREIVYFFDRQQVEGNEQTKAVVVRKINDANKENQTEYPNYIEIQDVYEITLYYRVIDVEASSFSTALDDIEQMGTETLRILETVFSPSMDNGEFWNADRTWHKHDMLDQAEPELRRTLTMRLSRITSFDGKLFKGYGGILHYGSTSGHIYAEINNIDTGDFGYEQIEEPIAGVDTPVYFTDVLYGKIKCDMYLSPNDIGINAWDINQIGTITGEGEVDEVTLIQLYDNDDGQRITITTQVKISAAVYRGNVEDMMKFSMTGQMIGYPTVTPGSTP